MRIVAWAMVVVVVIVAGLIGYSLFAAEMRVEAVAVKVVPATEMSEEFLALRQDTMEQAVRGLQFDPEELGDPSGYAFHIYSAQIRNNGFLQADWVRMDVQAQQGDILQSDKENAGMLPGGTVGELQTVVLARTGTATPRDLLLTYFVMGRPYKVSVRCN